MPAIPLTMTAGVIFGPAAGTAIVSVSATTAATVAFLIARYLARDRIMAYAQRNKRFAAIDRAISQNGLKFVTLLRLSPLLPFALSNYIYGLTSVDLGSYVLGSWLGMLPGTYAYVSAGYVGKAVLLEGTAHAGDGGGFDLAPWQIALGVGASILAIGFIGQLAKRAIEEADDGGGEFAPVATEEAAAAAAAASAAASAAADGYANSAGRAPPALELGRTQPAEAPAGEAAEASPLLQQRSPMSARGGAAPPTALQPPAVRTPKQQHQQPAPRVSSHSHTE